MTHMGNSLLPSSGPLTYRDKVGKFGTFQTRALPDLGTHGLFYARSAGDFAGQFSLVAMHPNGYSCDDLAARIIAAWETGDADRAMAQAHYILDCGGLCRSVAAMDRLAKGEW